MPEEIILAILCKFPKADVETVLQRTVKQLQEVCEVEADLKKYIKQLIVLSKLRSFDETLSKIVEDMPLTVDLREHYLYKKGSTEGIAKGIAKGEAQERAKNYQKKLEQAAAFLAMGISVEAVSTTLELPLEVVEKNLERQST